MLTPTSPSAAVSSASAPGRSGTGTWSTATPDAHLRLRGQREPGPLRLGERLLDARGSRLAATMSRRPSSRREYRSIASAIASRLATRISLHRRGFEAASRVRSRNPPAASSRISGSPASSVAARPMRAVEATCGRWLTIATSRSCRSASMRIGRRADPSRSTPRGGRTAPRPRPVTASAPTRCRPASEADALFGAGAFRAAHGVAPDEPCEVPRRSCRFDLGQDMGLHAPHVGDEGSRRRIEGPGDEGRDLRNGCADEDEGRLSDGFLEAQGRARSRTTPAARASTAGSVSNPLTSSPERIAARAIEVPTKPVPITATRSGEVIAKRLRAVEVDMGDVVGARRGVEVHQDAHDVGHRALHRDLAGAHQRHAS